MRKPGEVTLVGKILSEDLAFDNKFFPVVSRVIETPDGTIRDPQLLWDRSGKRFVIAIVTDVSNNFVLVREPKFGQLRFMISLPTGGIKGDEDVIGAAKREFGDETGYEAFNWYLSPSQPLLDFADKTDGGEHYIVHARGARKVGEPKGFGQSVVLADRQDALRSLLLGGTMPAMTMAAFATVLI